MSRQGLTQLSCQALRKSWPAALMIACILEVVAHAEGLGWIEPTAAQIINVLPSKSLLQRHEMAANPQAPRIVAIDDDLYISHFDQTSPLDQEKLARLIDLVASQRPAVIAIDLDLAPGSKGGEPVRMSEALRHSLKNATQKSDNSDHAPQPKDRTDADKHFCATRIVMIEPFVWEHQQSKGQQINSHNCEWAKSFEDEPCFHFAKASIQKLGNRALYYSPHFPGLGNVAYSAWKEMAGEISEIRDVKAAEIAACRGKDSPPAAAGAPKSEDSHAGPMRELINTDLISAFEVDRALHEAKERFTPLVSVFPQANREAKGGLVMPCLFGTSDGQGQCNSEKASKTPGQGGGVVFLGGAWGGQDKHATTWSEATDGVVIHAAIFSSHIWPIKHVVVWGFLIDLFIGIAFGSLFHLLWHAYNERSSNWANAAGGRPIWHPFVGCNALAAYPGVLAFGVLSWAALAMAVALAVSISSAFFLRASWFNPTAMVIGMFIHSLISSRPESAVKPGRCEERLRAFINWKPLAVVRHSLISGIALLRRWVTRQALVIVGFVLWFLRWLLVGWILFLAASYIQAGGF